MGLKSSKLFPCVNYGKEVRVLMVGLDAAGKTTILYKLQLGEVIQSMPTMGFNIETVKHKNVKFVVCDVGGQERIRHLWRKHCRNPKAVIFVVDSDDRERMFEAREMLRTVMAEEALRKVSLLVFANKQDYPNAMSISEISDKLSLHSLSQRRWHVQGSSATSGEGLMEGMNWVRKQI